MSIKVSWMSLGIVPEPKAHDLPNHAYQIRVEFGGWYSDRDIYLWWKEYGNDKCRKIASTKWKVNLEKIRESLKIEPKK